RGGRVSRSLGGERRRIRVHGGVGGCSLPRAARSLLPRRPRGGRDPRPARTGCGSCGRARGQRPDGARLQRGVLRRPEARRTFALDLPNRGEETFAQLARLEALAMEAGGALYPAKDARMSAETFARSFPRLGEFSAHLDPAFSSSFWRRVHR